MENLIGKTIGHYQVIEMLGEGGMATVFKAHDANLERDVAIKIIRREAFPPEQTEQLLKRFEREAKALAQMVHPNIVNVIDYGSQENNPYLVMNYLPGGTLKQKMGKPMPWQEAARLLLPVAEALDYAHSRGIVHRDVKPSNILLTQRGQPMLTDFGIAKLLESEDAKTLTGTGMGIGTPEYMAPEQWAGKVSPQTDIYALGVVFYELVTGQKPYTANTPAEILLKQATEPLPRPSSFVKDLPEKVEQILDKAIARNPDDRYPRMQDFASALEDLLGRRTEVQPVAYQPGNTPEPARIEAETTRIDRLPEPTPAGRLAATRIPTRPPFVMSWKLWVAAGVIVVVLGLGLAFGGRLVQLAKPGPTPTQVPTMLPATATHLPTHIPSATETPVPSSTLAPSATATPRLRFGQSLVSQKAGSSIYGLLFSKDGQTVTSGSMDPRTHALTMYTWALDTLKIVGTKNLTLLNNPDVLIGAFGPDLEFLVAGFTDGSIEFTSLDGTLLRTIPSPGAQLTGLAVSSDSQSLAGSYADNTIRVYQVSDGSLLHTIVLPSTSGRQITLIFSPDGQSLAVGLNDKMIRILRVTDGSLLQTLPWGTSPQTCSDFSDCLVFSPDGQMLAVSMQDNTVQVWRISDGSRLATLAGHRLPVSSIAFSPDGQLLAAGGDDYLILLWRISDGYLLNTLKGDTGKITSLAFISNGQILVSTSEDATIRLWGILP